MNEFVCIMNELSDISGCIWYVDLDDKIHIEYSAPEPFNPFDRQDRPEPEPTEDWRDEDEE